MSHDHPGQGPSEGRQNPGRGRDEFDHFFSNSSGKHNDATDPDATAWSGAGAPQYDGDRTQAIGHPSYVRPAQPQQYDEFAPAGQERYDDYAQADQDYYQPPGHFEEPRQRRGAMWAPVLVIVASLAIVAVVIAIILNNSSGRMAQGAFTPTATVTRTTTQDVSPSQSSSGGQSSSSSSSPSSSGSNYATSLPGDASGCPGSSSYGTGPRTSCEFAGVVSTLYNAKKNKDGEASFKAKSPETHRNYAVSCHADSYVTCTTETGAVIYILRG